MVALDDIWQPDARDPSVIPSLRLSAEADFSDAGKGGEVVEAIEQLGDGGPILGGASHGVGDQLREAGAVPHRVKGSGCFHQLRKSLTPVAS